MTGRRHPQSLRLRRALATVFAVVMLGLVTTALAATAVLMRNDVRRTRTLASDAQLRQLLLAGATDAVARSQSWDQSKSIDTWTVALPADPSLQSASIHGQLEPAADGSLDLHITATLADRTADESLHFRRAGGRWTPSDIQLGSVSTIAAHDRHNR